MTTLHQAATMALDALEAEQAHVYDADSNSARRCRPVITALRSALAAPQAEPVAWGMFRADGLILDVITPEEHESHAGEYTVPLYAAPPAAPAPAVPLTEKQVAAGIAAWFTTEIAGKNQPFEDRMRAAYAAINGIGGGGK